MENWRTRDISRPLTSLVVLVALCLTAVFVFYNGWYGLEDAAIYFGCIAFLLAVYLTYSRQWPRLIRYLRQLWRRSY